MIQSVNASEFVPPSMPRNASQWGAGATATPGGAAAAAAYDHQVNYKLELFYPFNRVAVASRLVLSQFASELSEARESPIC